MEPVMWDALNDIARERGETVHDLIEKINQNRPGTSLTAALRVYIVEYYRAVLRKREC
jgi:predicted DNA-binding ribbon-helix-helix protein